MVGIGRASAGMAMRGSGGLRGVAAAMLLTATLALGGCGSWVDPTEWFDDENPQPVTGSSSTATPAPSESRFPNLGRVPPRPVEVTSEGERREAVDSLVADSQNAQYTDQQLRGRPADSNTPPPAPRAPTSSLPEARTPAAAPAPRQAAAQQPAQPQVTLQPPAPTAPAAPRPEAAPARSGGSMTDVFAQSLAQSSATTLPPNLQQGPTGGPAGASAAMPAGVPGGSTLLAIVRFANADTSLNSDDRALVRRVADYHKTTAGGQGTLRVVGFASSRTGDMDPSAHRQLNYSLSQKRAQAVATELRRRGVAADRVQVEARADAAPVYYEAMPRAEDYNRRVEIYLVN